MTHSRSGTNVPLQSKMNRIYNTARQLYAKGFDAYGQLVGRHPVPFIVIPLLTFGLLGLGILRIESESDFEREYTPTNSQASQDRVKVKAIFPDMTGTNYNIYSINDNDRYGEVIFISEGDIFSNDSVAKIRDVVDTIKGFSIDFENTTLQYNDLCARRRKKCVISGEKLLSERFLSAITAGKITLPYWGRTDISYLLAQTNTSGTQLHSASILKIIFHLRQDTEDYLNKSKLWEDQFIKEMKNISFTNGSIAFASSQSLGDELNDNTRRDVFWFSLSFTLLITYASVVAAGGDCVGNTGHLARAGVIAAGLGILGAFGFLSLCGVKFVNIVGVMPFLVLSIGVDDMFLMLSAWSETNQHTKTMSVAERVGLTFRLAGVGITITSLTDFSAFTLGYTSVFLSVRNFCLFTGTAIMFCYLSQVTFFAGCLALHGRRVEQRRHCMTCLPITPGNKDKSCCLICCCSGKPPTTRTDSVLGSRMPILLTKYLLTKAGKIITLILVAVYVGFAVWGVTKLQQGLMLNNLVPPSSYYNTYVQNNFGKFGVYTPISFVIDEPIVYTNNLDKFDQLLSQVKEHPIFNRDKSVCWLHYYRNSRFFSNITEDVFVNNLKRFLSFNGRFNNDVVIKNNRISASRCFVISNNVPTSMRQADLMLQSRALAANSSLPVFAYFPLFIFFEQFVSVLPTVVQTVGIAIAVMVAITALLLPHPVIVILVFVNICLIVLGVLGFMAFWGLSLSFITMIHLIMCVGFSVDFSVHVCSAYMLADGTSRDERAKAAIVHAAGPVFNAGFSTFIGIVTLVASESYVFQSFFRIVLMVLLFGMASGVLFLPVVLSLIGPNYRSQSVSSVQPVCSVFNCIDTNANIFKAGQVVTCPKHSNKQFAIL